MPHYCFYLHLVHKLVFVYHFCAFTFYLRNTRLTEDPGCLVSIVLQRTESFFFLSLWNSVLKLRHLSTVVEKLLL